MSNNWRLECSCGSEDAAVPDEYGMNHAESDLLAILNARPQILAMCAAGIEFSIEVCGKYRAISSQWFLTHNGDGHVLRLIDENGHAKCGAITTKAPVKCSGCGRAEGELHERGCGVECCPFCGHQLIACPCDTKHFYPAYDGIRSNLPFCGLPESVYENGLPDEQAEEWERRLEAKGRIPYIDYPWLCARCGVLRPELFSVETEEWERYVEPSMRRAILCRGCFDWIKDQVCRPAT